MSKNLFSMNATVATSGSQEIYQFTSGAWGQVNATDFPSNGGTGAKNQRVFAYQGKLWGMTLDNAGVTITIAQWTGSAWGSPITSSSITTHYLAISNPIAWRGKMRWVLLAGNGVAYAQILSFDGTSITVQDVSASFGSGALISTENNYPAVPQAVTARLFLHDGAVGLAIGPSCNCPSPDGQCSIYGASNVLYLIDPSDSGCTVSKTYINAAVTSWDGPGGNTTLRFSVDVTPADRMDAWMLKGGMVTAFSFKGKLYVVGATGEIREVVNGVLQSAVVFDLRDIPGWPSFALTFNNNSTGGNGTFTINTAVANRAPSYMAFACGGKVTGTATSGAFTGAFTGTVTAWSLPSSSYTWHRLIDNAGARIGDIYSGSGTLKPGLVELRNNMQNTAWSTAGFAYAARVPTFHEYNGVGYLVIPGRWSNTTDSTNAMPTFVVKWNGTGTVFGAYGTTGLEAYQVNASGGVIPNMQGMTSFLDVEDGNIHIRYVEATTATARHLVFNTSSAATSDIGLVYSQTIGDLNSSRHAADNLTGFNTNDGGVDITGLTSLLSGSNVQIAYKLYSADSHTVNVSIEYDKGDGFTETVTTVSGSKTGLASSPGGTAQTYVHNTGVDIPNFIGTVAYRIRII